VVNYIDEKSLIRILKRYGEEKQAQLIAHAIMDSRYAFGKIKTTKQLADIVATAFQS
jgi:16S rRNA C1402 N4-methylase RsmH